MGGSENVRRVLLACSFSLRALQSCLACHSALAFGLQRSKPAIDRIRGGDLWSAPLLCSRARHCSSSSSNLPGTSGQDRNCCGNAGGSGASGNFQRTRWKEEGHVVRGFSTEIRVESGGRRLWKLAALAVPPGHRGSSKSRVVW